MKTLACLIALTVPLGPQQQSASADRAALTARCFAAVSDDTINTCTALIEVLAKDAPELPHAFYQRGLANRAKKQLDAALEDFSRVLEIQPGNVPTLMARGLLRRELGDQNGAFVDFNKAVEVAPGDANPVATRGWLKWTTGDRTSALPDLNRAVELAPIPLHLMMRGTARMVNDPAGARADFDLALAKDPRFGPAYVARADLESNLNNLDAAKADYTKSIEVDPNSARGFIGRARLLWANDDPAGAYRDFSRVVDLAPNSPTYRVDRAAAASAIGQSDVAMADYNFLIDHDPKFSEAYHFRGILKSDLHDFDGALRDFKTHNELLDGHPYVWLRLFLVEARVGDRAKAVATLSAAIDRLRADHAPDWPLKIADHLIGRLDSGALLVAALSRDDRTTKEHQCEAFFYVGWLHLLDHDEVAAKTAFERSVATSAYHMVELQSAKAELAFLSRKH